MGEKSFDDALKNSWKQFKDMLPGGMGDYLDPKAAFENVIKKNGVAVLTELKESREAVLLVWKLARGSALSNAEEQKIKDQLADMAKSIPALGVFALPGGMLLLPILAKALPWSILPSAFQKELEKKRTTTDPDA